MQIHRNQQYFLVGQRVEVMPPADDIGIGTVIETHRTKALDIDLETYTIRFDDGRIGGANDGEMVLLTED